MDEVLDFLQVDLFQAPARLFREGLGLARAAALLAELDDPQDRAPVVHVAGTAGKGTVASGIAAVLTDRGQRVGLHVSPHVYDLRERFTVNGAWCTPDQLVALLVAVMPAARRLAATEHGPPTFYEVTLAMALVHFREQACDLMVIETGLGGRFDATNTITRSDKLAVITRIDLDHEAVLGPTLADIADQKAGILARGGDAVVLHHGAAAIDETLAAAATRLHCQLHVVVAPTLGPGQVAHLVEDRALVAATVAELDHRAGRHVDAATLDRVLDELELPGRFEVLRTPGRTRVVLDGAHNPVKLAALIDRLRQQTDVGAGGWRAVFGCRRDKKAGELLAQLSTVVGPTDPVWLVQFPIPAGDVGADVSTDPDELVWHARSAGLRGAIAVGLDQVAALIDEEPSRSVVVVGSFHLLAALRPRLGIAPWPGGLDTA